MGILTCCNSYKRQKEDQQLLNQQEDRPALSQATHSRPPTASAHGNFGGIEEGEEVTRGSVITRQTDSLRRQQMPREVTPRLQRGQTPLEADAQSMQTNNSLAIGPVYSNSGTLNRASTVPPRLQINPVSTTDLLQEPDMRPAPPPYAVGRATSLSPNREHVHDGLYLV